MDSEKKEQVMLVLDTKKKPKKLQNNKILYIIFRPKFRRLPLKLIENNWNNQVLRKKSMQQNWRVHILCCNDTTTIINPKNCVIFFWDNFVNFSLNSEIKIEHCMSEEWWEIYTPLYNTAVLYLCLVFIYCCYILNWCKSRAQNRQFLN